MDDSAAQSLTCPPPQHHGMSHGDIARSSDQVADVRVRVRFFGFVGTSEIDRQLVIVAFWTPPSGLERRNSNDVAEFLALVLWWYPNFGNDMKNYVSSLPALCACRLAVYERACRLILPKLRHGEPSHVCWFERYKSS